MNIALIHLSDFHFKKEDYVIKEKIDKIAEAISKAGNIDECVVIFSGDMSFHGAQDEFPKARFTFSRLISILKAKYATGYIPLLCVPGNHDLVLSDSSRKFIDIAQYYEDGDIERHLELILPIPKRAIWPNTARHLTSKIPMQPQGEHVR